jgi:hypothetical protein
MAGALKTMRPPKAPKPVDPNKAVLQPPRLKPISTREYGKGGTPLSGAPNAGVEGGVGGYGGFKGDF